MKVTWHKHSDDSWQTYPEFYVRVQKLKIKAILVLLVIVVIAEVYFK